MGLFAPSLARAKRISSAATRAHDVGATSSLPPWHRSTAGGVGFPSFVPRFGKNPSSVPMTRTPPVTSARRGYPRARHAPQRGRRAACWRRRRRGALAESRGDDAPRARAPPFEVRSGPSTHRTAGSIPPHTPPWTRRGAAPFPFADDEGSATALHSSALRWLSRGSNHAPSAPVPPPTTNRRTGAPRRDVAPAGPAADQQFRELAPVLGFVAEPVQELAEWRSPRRAPRRRRGRSDGPRWSPDTARSRAWRRCPFRCAG